MKRFLALMALTVATSFGGTLIIDDFEDAQGPLTAAGSTGSTAVTAGAPGVDRTLELFAISNDPPIDYKAEVKDGVLNMINGIGDNSDVKITYNFANMLAIPPTASSVEFFITILGSDGNPSKIVLGGLAGGFANIPGNSSNLFLTFGSPGNIIGPGILTLTFSGDAGWDVAADNFGVQWVDTPEPGTMALLGGGLLVLGLARRRRA